MGRKGFEPLTPCASCSLEAQVPTLSPGNSCSVGINLSQYVSGCSPHPFPPPLPFARMAKGRVDGEGALYFDKARGLYVGEVRIDGRRRRVMAKRKVDASAKLGALIHADEATRKADRRITVAGLLDQWEEKSLRRRKLSASAVEIHQWAAARWRAEIGTVKLADLDVNLVESTLERMAKGSRSRPPLGKSSLGKMRSTMNQALGWAERRRMVTHNPAKGAEMPAEVKDGGARRALSPDELARLLDELSDHPWHAMFVLMARRGLRPGEAAGVCADAVDLEGDPPTVAVLRGVQLQRSRPVLADELKTARARRTLALPADVVEALRVPLAERRDGLLFTAPDGGPVWPSTVRSVLADACEAVGIDPVVRPNELRHTCATHQAEAGLPPWRIADLLGHTSTRMVDAVYRHRPDVIHAAD